MIDLINRIRTEDILSNYVKVGQLYMIINKKFWICDDVIYINWLFTYKYIWNNKLEY